MSSANYKHTLYVGPIVHGPRIIGENNFTNKSVALVDKYTDYRFSIMSGKEYTCSINFGPFTSMIVSSPFSDYNGTAFKYVYHQEGQILINSLIFSTLF